MSDYDEYDDESFSVDASFLAQVDRIAEAAAWRSRRPARTSQTATSSITPATAAAGGAPSKVWGAVKHGQQEPSVPVRGAPPRPTPSLGPRPTNPGAAARASVLHALHAAKPDSNPRSLASHTPQSPTECSVGNGNDSRTVPPARCTPTPHRQLTPPSAPSSDDFDFGTMSFTAESLAHLDAVVSVSQSQLRPPPMKRTSESESEEQVEDIRPIKRGCRSRSPPAPAGSQSLSSRPRPSLSEPPECSGNKIPQTIELTPRTAAAAGFSVIDVTWDDDGDMEDEPALAPSSQPSSASPTRPTPSMRITMPPPPAPQFSSPLLQRSPQVMYETPLMARGTRPRRPSSPTGAAGSTSEATPFPVRRPFGGRRAGRVQLSSSDCSQESPRPLQRRRPRNAVLAVPSSSSPVRAVCSASVAVDACGWREAQRRQRAQRMMDLDAGVSGPESSDESSGTESESDRRFAGDFMPTQAPRGYNQHAAYAAGLSTQAASRAGLVFSDHKRSGRGRGGGGEREVETGRTTAGLSHVHDSPQAAFLAKARRAVLVSDDEGSASDDEYELGSFVCDDDDILFDSQNDPLGSEL